MIRQSDYKGIEPQEIFNITKAVAKRMTPMIRKVGIALCNIMIKRQKRKREEAEEEAFFSRFYRM